MKNSIAAVVVTYNREKLLIECLDSLISQSRTPDAVFIVDNKSNSATPEILLKNEWIDQLPDPESDKNQVQQKQLTRGQHNSTIFYVRKNKNDGGAGGFFEGIKQACEKNYDYVWIMDDDVIAEPTALEELNNALQIENTGFLCSRVIGTNGVSMNMPEIDFIQGENYYPIWDRFLADGIARVKSATFVSVLLPRETIRDIGYPLKEMFIWGDDTEYTLRISKKHASYYVGKSVVCHKRVISKPPSIKTERDRKRLKMHYYRFRNLVYNTRKHMKNSQMLVLIGEFVYKMLFLLFRLRFHSFYTMLRGLLSGLFFNPKIQYPR